MRLSADGWALISGTMPGAELQINPARKSIISPGARANYSEKVPCEHFKPRVGPKLLK
jgi:hypothetical protein